MAQCTSSTEGTTELAQPWPSEWNTVAISLVASGFVELSQKLDRQGAFPVPYPPALQRGLDRLTAMGVVAEAEVPRSVMDLAAWAHRPFSEWPLRPDVEGLNDDESLLVDGKKS
ncbi:hypothetical protein [Nonomuraea sp. NPDC049309]|jgi:hypothetical protein|uniref:pPIWI_RE_Y domain-containing protein n=1 Tax=Nonomuraea sp. NPDC049309 TaxID=3364350 RepID=UPI003716CB11